MGAFAPRVDNMDDEITIFNERVCPICRINGSCKKWVFHFSYNRKARVCVSCVQKLGGAPYVVDWLAKHAVYHPISGALIGFRKEVNP